jgi:predicted AlkP superfamily pyrophosphatase or phosphodiesterase
MGFSVETARLDLDRVLQPGSAPAAVVLIVVDGVRPVDVFAGAEEARGVPAEPAAELTPNLHELMSRGLVLGGTDSLRPMRANGPNFLSLPGYTEMLTGESPSCQHNGCTERPDWTLVDAFRAAFVAHDDVAVITSWPNIGHIAASAENLAFVSTGREHAEALALGPSGALDTAMERGRHSPEGLGGADYRPDANTIEVALAYTTIRTPAFLFVSLGDTDEHAHEGDYPAYLAALRQADAFIGEMVARSRTWTEEGHPTVVIVTTDHGRGDDFIDHDRDHPESAAVWMDAAGPGIADASAIPEEGAASLTDVYGLIERIGGLGVFGRRLLAR